MGENRKNEEYKQMTALLQLVDLSTFSRDELLAFFINTYNSLAIHGFIHYGIPESFLKRISFFRKTSYLIGNQLYSLDDIENGVLRGNKRGPAYISKPFKPEDPRIEHILNPGEPRIHFALNCGASSFPPIKNYSADKVNEQLKMATESFFEDEKSLSIFEKENEIRISKILDWYKEDFGGTKIQLLYWIFMNMDPESEKKKKLGEYVEGKEKNNVKLTYWTYDWTSNKKSK